MPITLTVSEKRQVIENRCKQTLKLQMEHQITLDSMIELVPAEVRTEQDLASIAQLQGTIDQLGAQVAYFQAQWEALEDVEIDNVIDATSAPANGNGNREHRRAAAKTEK